MARGDRMSRPELAKYKYHIDLGGGGGTTWTGTIEKLPAGIFSPNSRERKSGLNEEARYKDEYEDALRAHQNSHRDEVKSDVREKRKWNLMSPLRGGSKRSSEYPRQKVKKI